MNTIFKKKIFWILLIIAVTAISILAINIVLNYSKSPSEKNKNMIVSAFPPDSKPYNKTYAEWSGQWWTLLQKLPTHNSSVSDTTGEKCNIGQNDSNVFFAMGTTGGTVERKCTISHSKAIFLPILTSECSDLEDKSLDTEQKRKNCVLTGSKNGIISVTIDGQNIPDLKDFWFEYPLINFKLDNDNIWGVKPGIANEYTGGYFVMLKPLPRGQHVIHFTGVNPDVTGTQTFVVDVTYRLDVV